MIIDNRRIIDVNLNRVKEGLRVVEDLLRFYYSKPQQTSSIKLIRGKFGEIARYLEEQYQINIYRNISKDQSKYLNTVEEFNKPNNKSILVASFKRAQESIRVLEEIFKIDEVELSKKVKELRFELYDIESHIIDGFNININNCVYVIHDDPAVLIESASSGADFIQLRDKQSTKLQIFNKAKMISENINEDVKFIINDHVDIAMMVSSAGVHLGQDDIPVVEARKLLGDKIIGLSTHCIEDANQAQNLPIDYIGVGPIYATPTKEGRAAVGLEYLDYVVKNINIPFFAIGGIDLSNINDVLSHGAKNIAVVRAYKDIKVFKEKLMAHV